MARRNLDKGAIAFCIFVNGEVAHIGFVAMSEEAKNTVDHMPYKVDFSNNEACTGATETVPEYRSKGLMGYVYFKRFQFLREKGKVISRVSLLILNPIDMQKVSPPFGGLTQS